MRYSYEYKKRAVELYRQENKKFSYYDPKMGSD